MRTVYAGLFPHTAKNEGRRNAEVAKSSDSRCIQSASRDKQSAIALLISLQKPIKSKQILRFVNNQQ
jgi:hypothetical protein